MLAETCTRLAGVKLITRMIIISPFFFDYYDALMGYVHEWLVSLIISMKCYWPQTDPHFIYGTCWLAGRCADRLDDVQHVVRILFPPWTLETSGIPEEQLQHQLGMKQHFGGSAQWHADKQEILAEAPSRSPGPSRHIANRAAKQVPSVDISRRWHGWSRWSQIKCLG